MDNLENTLRSQTIVERTQRAIEATFREIQLIDYLAREPLDKKVAILGAGLAVEIGAITSYFLRNGLNKPKIICFDRDPDLKEFTETLFGSQGIDFEYRISDITDTLSLKDEQYDMVIVRRPDVHNGERNWSRAFENGFNHLKKGGVFLATTDMYADFVREQLKRGGEIVKTYVISEINRVSLSFSEVDLFVAKK